jgi:hypothetical protein
MLGANDHSMRHCGASVKVGIDIEGVFTTECIGLCRLEGHTELLTAMLRLVDAPFS